MKLIVSCILSLIILSWACEGITTDGQIIIRVDDSTVSRCINSATDRITMHLRKFVVEKNAGLFTEDKTAGIIVKTTISGSDDATQKTIVFPRMYTTKLSEYSPGYILLPLEEKLFSRFPLTSEEITYDTAEIEFTILMKKDKTSFGAALSALADISKNMPTPINPFSTGFKYFSDYANKAVEASLNEANNVKDTVGGGKIILSFSPTDTCTGGQETTGTIAIISSTEGKEDEGFVDIKSDYCWRADFRPEFSLKFAKTTNDIPCKDLPTKNFKKVNNPHMAFYLNAERKDIASPKSKQTSMVFLPSTTPKTLNISKSDIQEYVAAVYKSDKNTVSGISGKVKEFLENPTYFPQGKDQPSVKKNQVNTFYWGTNVESTIAMDLAESARRCSQHGLTLENCF